MTGIIIILIIGAGAAAYGYARYKIRRFSRALFGRDSLAEGIRAQKEQLAETPKSVSAMTRIFKPQIERDFPEFNWAEYKLKAENLLVAFLLSITNETITGLSDASEDLKAQLSHYLADLKQRGRKETFQNIVIHDTEICRYEKRQGTCVITIQSAVGYLHYVMADGKLAEGSREYREQTKYNIELMYVQDAEKLQDGPAGLGLTCPQCGAPVKTLGRDMHCEYCGSAITAINIHTWAFNKIYKL